MQGLGLVRVSKNQYLVAILFSMTVSMAVSTALLDHVFYRQEKRLARLSVIGCEEEMQDLRSQLQEESAHSRQVKTSNFIFFFLKLDIF